jgi:hypothetical protein
MIDDRLISAPGGIETAPLLDSIERIGRQSYYKRGDYDLVDCHAPDCAEQRDGYVSTPKPAIRRETRNPPRINSCDYLACASPAMDVWVGL